MATGTDLRVLLLELEEGAPDVADVLESLAVRESRAATTPHRGRRWPVAATVAACVAVAVGVGALTTAPGTQQPSEAGRDSAPARSEVLPGWRFEVTTVPGYTVRRQTIVRTDPVTAQSQTARITATHGRVTGVLNVDRAAPGRSASTQGNFKAVADGETGPRRELSIDGRPAYFVAGTKFTSRQLRASDDAWTVAAEQLSNQPQLYWQLSDAATVGLSGTFGFRAATATWDNRRALNQLQALAHATTGVDRAAVAMPFRAAADPHGLLPLTVVQDDGTQCVGYGTATTTGPDDPRWNWYDLCRSRAGAGRSGDPGPIASRRLSDGTVLTLSTGGWPKQRTPISRAEAANILRDADVSPAFDDPGTWLTIR